MERGRRTNSAGWQRPGRSVQRYRHGQGEALGNRGGLLMEKLNDPQAARTLLTNAVLNPRRALPAKCNLTIVNCFRDSLNGPISQPPRRLPASSEEDYDETEKVLRKMLTEKPPASEQQRFAAARLLAECADKAQRSADAQWAVNVLGALDPTKLNGEQRTLADSAILPGARGRPEVQEFTAAAGRRSDESEASWAAH